MHKLVFPSSVTEKDRYLVTDSNLYTTLNQAYRAAQSPQPVNISRILIKSIEVEKSGNGTTPYLLGFNNFSIDFVYSEFCSDAEGDYLVSVVGSIETPTHIFAAEMFIKMSEVFDFDEDELKRAKIEMEQRLRGISAQTKRRLKK